MKRSLIPAVMIIIMLISGCGNSYIEERAAAEATEQKVVKSPDVKFADGTTADGNSTDEGGQGSTDGFYGDSDGTDAASAYGTPVFNGPVDEPDDSLVSGDGSSLDESYIDLTQMSSTMRYSQVYNMMFYPEKYVGKTIKMEGIYSDYFDMATGKHYYGCIIMDATACCSQGVEFEPTSQYAYPDDYPKEGDTITVEGTFDTYEEDGNMYCTLRNASFM